MIVGNINKVLGDRGNKDCDSLASSYETVVKAMTCDSYQILEGRVEARVPLDCREVRVALDCLDLRVLRSELKLPVDTQKKVSKRPHPAEFIEQG